MRDGSAELNDFTLPSSQGTMGDVIRQEDLPEWIQDSLSVLAIVDQGVSVAGLGKKIDDSLFYVVEPQEVTYGGQTGGKG